MTRGACLRAFFDAYKAELPPLGLRSALWAFHSDLISLDLLHDLARRAFDAASDPDEDLIGLYFSDPKAPGAQHDIPMLVEKIVAGQPVFAFQEIRRWVVLLLRIMLDHWQSFDDWPDLIDELWILFGYEGDMNELAPASDKGIYFQGDYRGFLEEKWADFSARLNEIDGYCVRAEIRLLATAEGGKATPVQRSYRPNHNFFDSIETAIGFIEFPEGFLLHPGESATVFIQFAEWDRLKPELYAGREWRIQEGAKLVGYGTILEVLD